jgi:hypothetical protein
MKLMPEKNHEFARIMNCEIMKCKDPLYKIHPFFIFCPQNGGVVIFCSFLLLRPPRTSEVLKKGSNFGFLTLKYA